MRIEVLGDDAISAQARTYAEYRLFAALSQVVDTHRVTHARVVLEGAGPAAGGAGVSCTVSVGIGSHDGLHIRAVADHPYAAINRAVERLARRGWRLAAMSGDATAAHAVAE